MPAGVPDLPELSEVLLLPKASVELTDERSEFGVYTGRRYVREYTILTVAMRGENVWMRTA